MKKLFLSVTFLLSVYSVISQQIDLNLKSGSYNLNQNLDCDISDNDNKRLLFFSVLPTEQQKVELQKRGVKFLYYLPKNIFAVSLKDNISLQEFANFNILSVNKFSPTYKIDKKLKQTRFPVWTIKEGLLHVKVLLFEDIIISDVVEDFRFLSESIEDVNEFSHSITISLNPQNLNLISELNSVSFIEPIDPPSEKENHEGRTLHRSNVINTNFSTGRHYDGSGINVMMQDDGLIGPHIDYQGRIDQSNCTGCSSSFSNDHGDHVAGTIMGSGNLDPLVAGMANGAFLYVYSSSDNNYYDVPTIYQNNDVIITSKSYSNGCNAGYTSLSKDLDEQILLYPSLIHVFSAGNSGTSDCGYGAGSNWGNVTGGHKQAKNVIAVANLNGLGVLASSSSRGPAADGRIKPDIGAKGTSVNSTIPENNYGLKTGTSMSCPGIAGILAQLYQAYKDLNGGVNPPSALMKCILLNSADDLGNPGPDFKYGWGEVNAFKAVKMLENSNYTTSSVSQSGVNTHSITIPSGTKQVKIMTYWHDKEASTSASIALVNDINTTLSYIPLGTSYSPLVLDESPNQTSLNSIAIPSIDDLNNMEQIIIDNPIAGNYTLNVNGFAVPYGPQEYWITYEFISEDVELTFPIGGEGFVPGESEFIRWDASEGTTPFMLEYTIDGTNWIIINSTINSNSRYYSWLVPNTVSDNVKVRVSRSASIDESDENFTIVGVPQNVFVDWVCPDSIYVFWNAVSGATSYEVSMLGNVYMDSMTTTTNTMGFILNTNSTNTDSWFSVCAKVNNNKGRRAIAVNAQPTNSGCVSAPIANFSFSTSVSCTGDINFIDNSQNQPNSWLWDFGDGTTSSLQNPVHSYLQQGSYSVQLIVSNSLGIDTVLQNSVVTIAFFPAPIVDNDTSYVNPSTFVLTSLSNNVKWYADTLGSAVLYSGANFTTPLLTQNTTYYVREFGGTAVYGGPADNTIGSGGYYNNDRHLFLDCYTPSTIISFDVYAGTAQSITFELRDNNSNILEDTTITVQVGLNTLYIDFDVPVMNDLELGMNSNNSDLYRNSTGSAYPYSIGTLASITGHNSPNSASYHYFFYNVQMRENCKSEFAEATAVFLTAQTVFTPHSDFKLYPNPSSNYLFVENKEWIKRIKIYDIHSREVFSENIHSKTKSIDVSTFSSGVYFIELHTENSIIRKEFVIQNDKK